MIYEIDVPRGTRYNNYNEARPPDKTKSKKKPTGRS